MLKGEFTLMTPEMVANPDFISDYGLRVRLLRMMEQNTLLLAKVSLLIFPKLVSNAVSIHLFFDPNGSILGTFAN